MNYRSLLIIITIAFLFGCKGVQQSNPQPAAICITDSMANIIAIDTARLISVDDELKLSGEINFDDRKVSKIYPFSSGQILQVNVSLGDKVNKGQKLAVIKSADVSGNYSDLSTAGNDVAIAKKQMENEASLFSNGIASEKDYLEAKENYQKAVTAAEKLKNQIRINGGGRTSANGTYIITAPISGYVVEKKINPGGFIRSDANDNLFTIGDISDVWVWANVYETDISKVKRGYAARVTTLAYPDSVFTGVIDEVSNVLDPVTKVMKIRVRLPNTNQSLKPEMFANILITNKEGKRAIGVPAKAIISENGKDYVILYKSKCDLGVKEIELLKKSGGMAYIKSGLKAGEQVISQNQVLLFKALTEK
ncbi:MAG: efflux transporter periplasmic adaptor subunit [Ferruginibacter sp.]|nr:efflux transporter periplasmic adaptor subunit [Ferruginibacter sp.]